MPSNRRTFIKKTLVASGYASFYASALLHYDESHAAWIADQFTPASLSETLQKLYGGTELIDSDQILLKVPRVAENGAVVPVNVSSTLPNVTNITLFVTKNPTPLSISFQLSPLMDAVISTRIKMAETSSVIAVVQSDGLYYKTRQDVTVTIGGCGG